MLYVYVSRMDSYGVPTPSEVALMYGGRCPVCGAPLGRPRPGDVRVREGWSLEEVSGLVEEWLLTAARTGSWPLGAALRAKKALLALRRRSEVRVEAPGEPADLKSSEEVAAGDG